MGKAMTLSLAFCVAIVCGIVFEKPYLGGHGRAVVCGILG